MNPQDITPLPEFLVEMMGGEILENPPTQPDKPEAWGAEIDQTNYQMARIRLRRRVEPTLIAGTLFSYFMELGWENDIGADSNNTGVTGTAITDQGEELEVSGMYETVSLGENHCILNITISPFIRA